MTGVVNRVIAAIQSQRSVGAENNDRGLLDMIDRVRIESGDQNRGGPQLALPPAGSWERASPNSRRKSLRRGGRRAACGSVE
jgi:hypothetical protein